MRVALVGDRPPPYGGIAVHVETLAAQLRGLGHEVAVLDTARVRSYGPFAAALASLAARGYLLHVHTSGHNPKSWALTAAGGLARSFSRPNVVTLHSGLLPGYLEGMPGRQRIARAALAPYGWIVAVSATVKRALESAGIERARIAELPAFCSGGVKPGELPAAAKAIRAQHPVLLAANLADSPIYGARVLWAAVAQLRRQLPELGVVVFGPGTRNVAQEVSPLGLADCVHGLGEVEHAEALATIAASDVFVRPTLADGDAITVREALTMNTRTVASDVCARPEGTQRFRAGDPFSLAESIQAALASPAPQVAQGDALPGLISIYRELTGELRRTTSSAA